MAHPPVARSRAISFDRWYVTSGPCAAVADGNWSVDVIMSEVKAREQSSARAITFGPHVAIGRYAQPTDDGRYEQDDANASRGGCEEHAPQDQRFNAVTVRPAGRGNQAFSRIRCRRDDSLSDPASSRHVECEDHHAQWGATGVSEAHDRFVDSWSEQLFAGAEHNRMKPQTNVVDEP